MRRVVFSILCLGLFACGLNSKKEPQTKKTQSPLEKTSIVFNEKMHNFGKLKAGEIVLYTFEFTNTGTDNYQIENIHTDCGCVKTNFGRELVKPGKTGLIEIEFDTAGLVGNEYKTIEIHGNSEELKHLAIFAEVKNEIFDIKF